MSDNGRSPRKLLVFALALPIFALVYLTTFGGRLWAALRPSVATALGVTVIGSVYAGEAYKRAPQTPMRAAAVLALAVALVGPAVSAPPTVSAADPAEAVIAAAREYLGADFRLGTEGPRTFDCSGLVFRAFSDAGELPRIGGMRLRAAGYMQWFVSRGRFTKDVAEARRGDLVIYDRGEHVGIYLGDGQVISALIQPWGVSVHSLRGIHLPVSYFLHVNWGSGDGNNQPGDPTDPGKGNNGNTDAGKGTPGDSGSTVKSSVDNSTPPENPDGNAGNGDNNQPDSNNPGAEGNGENVRPDGVNAIAIGTMNLRLAGEADARIIGWIGRGGYFKVVDQQMSSSGYLWYHVQTRSGKDGWVYSRWVRELN